MVLGEARCCAVRPVDFPRVYKHEPGSGILLELVENRSNPCEVRSTLSSPMTYMGEAARNVRLRQKGAGHLGVGVIPGGRQHLRHRGYRRRQAIASQPSHSVLGWEAPGKDGGERRGGRGARGYALAELCASLRVGI